MTSAYAINTQKVEIVSSFGEDFSEPRFVGNFSINSKLEHLGIDVDSDALVMIPENKDLRFTSAGKIINVFETTVIKPTQSELLRARVAGSPPPRDTYRHNFQIEITQKLVTNNLLSQLEYSIKDVYRYNNPAVHFQTQYREIKKDDFETIIDGLIYTARTAFGKLINSIPRQNKLEFMIQAMNEYSTIDFAKIPLQLGLNFLYDYLERRILKKGWLLVETDRILNEKFNDVLAPKEIGFVNPSTETYNNISTQANYFNELFRLERQHNFRDYVNQKILENPALEERFNKIFEKETWPIDLKL